MIPEKLLKQCGAKILFYKKGDFIYREGDRVSGYFQILVGKIKLNNYSEDGVEFIQNIFEEQQSFGDALLFISEPYPTNAIAVENVELYHLSVNQFFQLLKTNPECALLVCEHLSQRLYYKMLMAQSISSKFPEIKIITLLDYFKYSHCHNRKIEHYEIPLTRQQIADLTGLRVETVIRTVKKLEQLGKLRIIDRKILY